MNFDWIHRDTHDATFNDGDRYLVAVPLHEESGGGYDIQVVTFSVDEHRFCIECNDEPWGWEWADVEWWINLAGKEPKDQPLYEPARV